MHSKFATFIVELFAVGRTPWPKMNSPIWVSVSYESLFLQFLLASDSWIQAGLYWRSHFFIRGQLYREKTSGFVFRALNANHHMAALWPVWQLSSSSSHTLDGYWAPCTKSDARPAFKAMLDWDDFEAATCNAISPLGLVANGCPWNCLPSSIGLLQTSDFQDVRAIAARKSFLGCSKEDLKSLAKESGISSFGCCCCVKATQYTVMVVDKNCYRNDFKML